jgi:quaternary ammonium compound-resistance protein SugE
MGTALHIRGGQDGVGRPFCCRTVAVLGIVLFREPATGIRLACIALILAGIVGLKITSGPPA